MSTCTECAVCDKPHYRKQKNCCSEECEEFFRLMKSKGLSVTMGKNGAVFQLNKDASSCYKCSETFRGKWKKRFCKLCRRAVCSQCPSLQIPATMLQDKVNPKKKKHCRGCQDCVYNLEQFREALMQGDFDKAITLYQSHTEILLDRPFEIFSDHGYAVHYASLGGSSKILKWLVDVHHCDVNVTDKDGATPIEIAASKRNLVILHFLLRRGAKIEMIKNPEILHKVLYTTLCTTMEQLNGKRSTEDAFRWQCGICKGINEGTAMFCKTCKMERAESYHYRNNSILTTKDCENMSDSFQELAEFIPKLKSVTSFELGRNSTSLEDSEVVDPSLMSAGKTHRALGSREYEAKYNNSTLNLEELLSDGEEDEDFKWPTISKKGFKEPPSPPPYSHQGEKKRNSKKQRNKSIKPPQMSLRSKHSS